MSQKSNIIIAIQDNTLMENTLVIWLYFTVVIFFVFLVAAIIMRKELKKALAVGNYTPNSQAPKMYRIFMVVFFVASVLSGIVSGVLLLKVQDIRHKLQDQAIMLENAVNDETQAIIEQELKQAQDAMAPITPEEMAQIDKEVRQEIAQTKRHLEEEAKRRAANNPTTTVEKELHNLMNQVKIEVDKAQGHAPAPVPHDPNKSGQENFEAVVSAILTEPIKQIQEAEKAKIAEQAKKEEDRVVSTQ